jgi:hypothetical protein
VWGQRVGEGNTNVNQPNETGVDSERSRLEGLCCVW